MCVDESNEANQIVCIDNEYCNKLIAHIQLEDISNKNIQICLRDEEENFKRIFRKKSNQNLDFSGDFNVTGFCLVPNSILKDYNNPDIDFPLDFISFNYHSNHRFHISINEWIFISIIIFLMVFGLFIMLIIYLKHVHESESYF